MAIVYHLSFVAFGYGFSYRTHGFFFVRTEFRSVFEQELLLRTVNLALLFGWDALRIVGHFKRVLVYRYHGIQCIEG